MIHPDFTYKAHWLFTQDGVGPMFRAVDRLLADPNLSELEMCTAIFNAGKAYHCPTKDQHDSFLESLFDSLAICEYVLTLNLSCPSKKHFNLMLICMEFYLKASMFKFDEWMNPGKITEAEIAQLELELPRILNRLREVNT